MEVVVSDSDPEIKNVTIYLQKKYKIKYIKISVYNLKVNGLIKIGYKSIVQALQKLTFRLDCDW